MSNTIGSATFHGWKPRPSGRDGPAKVTISASWPMTAKVLAAISATVSGSSAMLSTRAAGRSPHRRISSATFATAVVGNRLRPSWAMTTCGRPSRARLMNDQ
ncbi:hypothetical protein [Nonomuraea wenchangensis]|uniref:hypothetical protein n=1 Tax=Nonomuraea wenchangensis TaxID=568860 RepID=UPI00378EE6BC